MAQLFGVDVPAISKHLNHIFDERELNPDTTISKMEIVVNRGYRGKVTENVAFYSLDESRDRCIISTTTSTNRMSATK